MEDPNAKRPIQIHPGEFEECILPRPGFDPEAEPERLDDPGPSHPATTPEDTQDEIRVAEKPQNLNDLVESEGSIALVYKCGRCGKIGFVPDPGAVMAASRGVGVGLRCGICHGDIVILTKEAKKAKQLVQPANVTQMPRNRHERLAALAKIRKAITGDNGGSR